MRIAPVGLVYRNASLHSLQEAVTAALLCTHVHPVAVEGALTQALAVAELCKQAPPCPAGSRGAGGGGTLLRHLQQKLSGGQHGMPGKLALLEQALQGVSSRIIRKQAQLCAGGWEGEGSRPLGIQKNIWLFASYRRSHKDGWQTLHLASCSYIQQRNLNKGT